MWQLRQRSLRCASAAQRYLLHSFFHVPRAWLINSELCRSQLLRTKRLTSATAPAYISDSTFLSLETASEALALAEESLCVSVLESLNVQNSQSTAPRINTSHTTDTCRSGSSAAHEVDPMMLFSRLIQDPHEPLPASDVFSVLENSFSLYGENALPLEDVIVPRGSGARLVLVGDLHGQLADLLWIFHENGVPAPNNAYFFNGDICDRGTHSVEIWILVLAFKLRFPKSVTILRGNHENAALNERPARFGGGFAESCAKRYASLPFLYQKFQRLFIHLPLFAVIENQLFVVHAGLPRVPGVTLDELRRINHMRHYPAGRTRKEIEKRVQLNWSREDAIIFDAQWADPYLGSDILAEYKPSPRGSDVIKFGKKVTHSFLFLNKLELVIRSHEVPRSLKGTQFEHGKRLLTVFSASKYGGAINNTGGVARISYNEQGKLKLITREHTAPDISQIPNLVGNAHDHHNLTFSRVQDLLAKTAPNTSPPLSDNTSGYLNSTGENQNTVLDMMVSRAKSVLCARRDDLWNFCTEHAVQKGRVNASEFASVLGTYAHVADVDVDIWRPILANGLGAVDTNGLVDYEALLSRFHVEWPLVSTSSFASDDAPAEAMQHLMATTLSANLTLQETKALFDKNLSDNVDVAECRQVLSKLLPALSRRQMHHIVDTLRKSWGGSEEVRVDRFLVALFVEFPAPRPAGASMPPKWFLDARLRLAEGLASDRAGEHASKHALGEALLETFRAWDVDGNGLLQAQEIMNRLVIDMSDELLGMSDFSVLQLLGINDEQRLNELVEYLDATGSGSVSIFEFLQAFLVEPDTTSRSSKGDSTVFSYSLSDDVCSTWLAVLRTHRSTLLRGCRALDVHMRGSLGRLEFIEVVKALLKVLKQQDRLHPNFTSKNMSAIEYLSDRLPYTVNYADILGSLRIVEREQPLR